MKIFSAIDRFFFERIDARGFGLMRICWALCAGVYLLFQWSDVARFYSDSGYMPHDILFTIARNFYRFSILDFAVSPEAVFALYVVLLICLLFSALGIFPRVSTIASTILLFSFHERNPFTLGGGDTVLRVVAFLLCIAPSIDAFSVKNAVRGYRVWKLSKTMPPCPTMAIWPYRLLMWQMIVLYTTALWYKLLGTMWRSGTAIAAVFHHPMFSRFGEDIMWLAPSTRYMIPLILLWHILWMFLLVPKAFWNIVIPPKYYVPHLLRRVIMIGGMFYHVGILVLMDAGSFSIALLAAYCGLLHKDDFSFAKKLLSDGKTTITLMYDGTCGLCSRSTYTLLLCNWLSEVQAADFHNAALRKQFAPKLAFADLDRSIHGIFPDGSHITGFRAFRAAAWSLPPLWILLPILYIPGVPVIGEWIYKLISKRRKRCTHEHCR